MITKRLIDKVMLVFEYNIIIKNNLILFDTIVFPRLSFHSKRFERLYCHIQGLKG